MGSHGRRRCLEAKRRLLEKELRPKGIDVDMMSTREAWLQALMSRGDRRRADLLELAHRETGGDLQEGAHPLAARPGVLRDAGIGTDEVLPWDSSNTGYEEIPRPRAAARRRRPITPKCRVDTCRACGLACADHPELVEPLDVRRVDERTVVDPAVNLHVRTCSPGCERSPA